MRLRNAHRHMTKAHLALAATGLLYLMSGHAADSLPLDTSTSDAWSGPYVGLTVGNRQSKNDWTTSNVAPLFSNLVTSHSSNQSNIESSTTRLSGLIGNNWRLSQSVYGGVEADFGVGDSEKSQTLPGGYYLAGAQLTDPPTVSVKNQWDASLRLRLGFLATPSTMLYGTAGYAWQSLRVNANCSASSGFCTWSHDETASKVVSGWTAGVGMEHKLQKNVALRLEYRYSDYRAFQHTFFTFDGSSDDRFTANVKTESRALNLGLVYQF